VEKKFDGAKTKRGSARNFLIKYLYYYYRLNRLKIKQSYYEIKLIIFGLKLDYQGNCRESRNEKKETRAILT
jgi:hypothetical protein